MRTTDKVKNYKKVSEKIIRDFLSDEKNITEINQIASIFSKKKLFIELIELYKMEFYYTLNPLCFEKIGDIQYKQKLYDEALDSYLSCAEISENYAQIYKKLGKVFGEINDNDSRLACLEQVKIIESKNGK